MQLNNIDYRVEGACKLFYLIAVSKSNFGFNLHRGTRSRLKLYSDVGNWNWNGQAQGTDIGRQLQRTVRREGPPRDLQFRLPIIITFCCH